MLNRFFAALLVITWTPQQVFAELPQAEHQRLEKFVSDYKKLHTVSELLDASAGSLADYLFIKEKIGNQAAQELPGIRLMNDSLQFKMKDDVFSIRVLSLEKRKFSLNRHVLDLSRAMSPREKWDLIEKAMPKSKVSAWLWLVPEARANPFELGIAVVALVVGAAGSGYSAFLNTRTADENNCQANWEAVDTCKRQLGIVNEYIRVGVERFQKQVSGKPVAQDSDSASKKEAAKAEAVSWANMIEQMKEGQCPLPPLNPDLDKSTAEVISTVLRTVGEKNTIWSSCAKYAREQAGDCVDNLANDAKDICFNLTKTAYEGIKDTKLEPPNLVTVTKGIVPRVNPQDAPPKAVEEKSEDK